MQFDIRKNGNGKLHLFGYDAANPGKARGQSGGLAKNSSTRSARMQNDRVKLMWEARDLERNMPIIRGCLDRMEKYVCGQIQYKANTGDTDTNIAYQEYFNEWAESKADVTGRFDFRMLVALAYRSMKRDGDFGFVEVFDEGDYQLQAIESDRIGDPTKPSLQSNPLFISGITINDKGKPLDYELFKRDQYGKYTKEANIESKNFIHIFKPSRVDEYRGVSWFAPVIGQARDLYETFQFERGAAKWAASITGVVRSDKPNALKGAAHVFDGLNTDGSKSFTAEANKILALQSGESVDVFSAPNRPSGAFMALIEATVSDIAMGLDLPIGFFDMRKFGGATARLEIQQLQRSINLDRRILEYKVLNRVKNMVLSIGISKGEIPPSQYWRSGKWNYGASMTADIGYQTNADLALLSAGIRTKTDIIAEYTGEEFENVIETSTGEVNFIRKTCAEQEVPIEIAFPQMANASPMFADMESAKNPPPPPDPSISGIGEKAVSQIAELLEKVATGIMPREAAIEQLMTLYKVDRRTAELIAPEAQPQPQPEPVQDVQPQNNNQKQPVKQPETTSKTTRNNL